VEANVRWEFGIGERAGRFLGGQKSAVHLD
jgi:hypothetical protein